MYWPEKTQRQQINFENILFGKGGSIHMDVYEAAISRRAIKRFKDIPIPYDVLENCVNAARLAPSGKNRQLCEYIIIDDKSLLPKVFDNVTIGGDPPPEQMPRAYILSLINTSLERELEASRIVTIYGDGMAVENMILVALEQGIGSCPIMGFKENDLKQLLNIPDKYEIALVLALGYPDEKPVVEISDGSIQSWRDKEGTQREASRGLPRGAQG
jgi:nitroreductase